jgi:predicted ArsR family transcriptional regulator
VQATRFRILEIIKEQGDATVAELAVKLDMAPVSVRHHLDVLQGENLICSPRVRRPGTVGRPQQIYALTEAASAHFPRNHDSLAARMLDEVKAILPPDQLHALFERMADGVARDASPLPADAPLERRIEHAVDFLNEKGYLARSEKRDGHFLLVTLNCPYAGVAEQHRELCAMDMRLMNHLLGVAPTPVGRLSEGECRCTYRIDAPSSAGLTQEGPAQANIFLHLSA